jgi:hypothetical protein
MAEYEASIIPTIRITYRRLMKLFGKTNTAPDVAMAACVSLAAMIAAQSKVGEEEFVGLCAKTYKDALEKVVPDPKTAS